jgi:hypothetical protein
VRIISINLIDSKEYIVLQQNPTTFSVFELDFTDCSVKNANFSINEKAKISNAKILKNLENIYLAISFTYPSIEFPKPYIGGTNELNIPIDCKVSDSTQFIKFGKNNFPIEKSITLFSTSLIQNFDSFENNSIKLLKRNPCTNRITGYSLGIEEIFANGFKDLTYDQLISDNSTLIRKILNKFDQVVWWGNDSNTVLVSGVMLNKMFTREIYNQNKNSAIVQNNALEMSLYQSNLYKFNNSIKSPDQIISCPLFMSLGISDASSFAVCYESGSNNKPHYYLTKF